MTFHPHTRRLLINLALALVLTLAGIGVSKIISTNTVRHKDCLSGYRVVDC